MADSEGKGAPRNDHTMNHQSYSPVVKHFAVVSDGLRSTLIWSKLKNFPRGACPQTLLERCALYVRKEKIPHAARLRAPHGRTNSTLCVPPPSSTSGSAPEGVHVLNNALHVYKCTELKVWGILLSLEKCSKVDTLKLPHRTQSFTKAFA